MTLLDSKSGRFISPPAERLTAWVTSSTQNPTLGILQPGSYVYSVRMHVTQAFNSDGTDNISVGYDGTTNAYCTNTDVSTTGVKTPTLGSGIGYDSTARTVEAYYTNGGSEPSAGKALVIVEFFRVPLSP